MRPKLIISPRSVKCAPFYQVWGCWGPGVNYCRAQIYSTDQREPQGLDVSMFGSICSTNTVFSVPLQARVGLHKTQNDYVTLGE